MSSKSSFTYLIILTLSILNSWVYSQSATCATAINLVPTTTCCAPYNFQLVNGNSGQGATGCVSSINDDGWFKFTAIGTATSINIIGANNPIACVLYSGTCANLTILACDDDGNTNLNLAANTTPGTIYFIRIIRTNAGSGNTTGTICVTASNNFVTNGGFELGTSSWTNCGNSVEALNTSQWHGGVPPFTPNNFAEIDAHFDLVAGTSDDMTICQNVSGLTSGTQYSLCMNIQRRPGPAECYTQWGMPATVSSTIAVNNGALNTTVSQSNTLWEWETVCFTFTANSPTHQLTMTPQNNSTCGMLVTNITISEIISNGVTTLTENVDVCSGDDYTFPDGTIHTNITLDESYVSNLTYPSGCDSLITTNITVHQMYSNSENISVCMDDTVTYPDGSTEVITANTSHVSQFTSIYGCDSTITTNVSLNGGMNYNLSENISVCPNSTIIYPDGTSVIITSDTSHTSNLTTIQGCDSIIVTNVTMLMVYSSIENETICSGSDFIYPDGTIHFAITVDEAYTSVLTAMNGCDSTVLTNITVESPLVNAGIDQEACEGSAVSLIGLGNGQITWNNGIVNNSAFVPPVGNNNYVATVTSINGCTNTDTVIIVINALPIPQFVANVSEGCEPLDVLFTNLTSNTQSCFWDFGNNMTSFSLTTDSVHYDTNGSYSVSLTVTDIEGCTGTTTLIDYITVHPNPIASFNASPQTIDLFSSEVSFDNTTINGSNYSWDFGDFSPVSTDENPVHTFSGEQSNYQVILTAESVNGCLDVFSLVITYKDLQVIFVPNTFTPDGDEYNNEFTPILSDGYDPSNYVLTIYNRWGELIFESIDINKGWDGTYRGVYSKEGIYTWKIEVKQKNNDDKLIQLGHVLLMR